jgi:hypothetical protein
MIWKKKGMIFCPDGSIDWMKSHAMMPVVYQINDDLFRVFFSPRDALNRSRCASIDLLYENDSFHLDNLTKEPILDLGPLGAFDDSGIMPTSIIEHNDLLYMYYNGWTLGKNVPFFSFNGVAISNDKGKSFKKYSKGPVILYRNNIDPFSTFAPFVIQHNGKFMMWYVSLIRWELNNGIPKHYYHIKFAESNDGINWIRNGIIAIDFKNEYEYAIARPMVIFENSIFKMWYSYRAGPINQTYRIGYSESINGIEWVRKDNQISLDVSPKGWDSEMICYSYVFKCHDQKFMLYNGNSYGKTGFGLALLEEN